MTFDWFLERLDLARWESETPGARSGFFSCPIHGGSDSLHVTEKNGKALIKCFACDASASKVQEALESETVTPSVTVKKSAGATGKNGLAGKAKPSRGVRLPAASTTPEQWLADRCSLTLEQLQALDLPLADAKTHIGFDFPGIDAVKLRKLVAEGEKDKGISWMGLASPFFWPMPEKPGSDIVICEGEADAVCLRASGYEAYSITKGANTSIPSYIWDALAAKGVENVALVYDMDKAGREGRLDAADGARAAGMIVREMRVKGIRPLEGEKDVRDVARRQGYPLLLEADADEDDPMILSSIDPIEPEPLLLDRLHATEHTILFGDGGAGKGVIAAWLIARLTRQGMKVLVVDYEYHANLEWRPRVEGFGGDMDAVGILQPSKPIWEIASWLRDKAATYDYVVVDSVSYACVGEEVEKSVTATRYTMAINIINKPVLSIAHVTKENPDPNHPFGSIFWSNGARMTIALGREKIEDPESVRIIRNPKTNQRGSFAPVGIDWTWLYENGPPGCGGGPRCPGVPSDQQGMPRHLHEVALTPQKRQTVKETRSILQVDLGREPTGPEIFERIRAEYGDGFMSEGHVKKELSDLKKREGPSVVVRNSDG